MRIHATPSDLHPHFAEKIGTKDTRPYPLSQRKRDRYQDLYFGQKFIHIVFWTEVLLHLAEVQDLSYQLSHNGLHPSQQANVLGRGGRGGRHKLLDTLVSSTKHTGMWRLRLSRRWERRQIMLRRWSC